MRYWYSTRWLQLGSWDIGYRYSTRWLQLGSWDIRYRYITRRLQVGSLDRHKYKYSIRYYFSLAVETTISTVLDGYSLDVGTSGTCAVLR